MIRVCWVPMIRAFRRTPLTSLFAAVVLFATMPVTVSSLLHEDVDDAVCNQVAVIHDADAHSVGGADPEVPRSEHCVLCHALQSLRAVQAFVRFAPPLVDARLVACGSNGTVNALIVSTRPARAPPLT